MQPTLCSRCKKNVAVIFITRMDGGEPKNEGLCLKCARELHIKPVDDVINKMGLTDDELAGQYKYTQDIATADGVLKGVTWQATPGLFAYRRSIAKDVLGTDDPAEVQEKLNSWEKFNAVAAEAKAKGYLMTASEAATYRVFSNNVTSPWVDENNNLQIDPAIQTWMQQAKDFSDNGTTSSWAAI